MAPFTVALDARYLTGERKGIGRYLHTLLSGFAAHPKPPALALISDRPINAPYTGLDVRTVIIPGRPVYLWEQVKLPRALRRIKADLFHAPGNALPLRPPRPTVLTLHDVMMFERGLHTAAANRYYLYQSLVLRRAAARCAAIITVSQTSARDITRRLGPALAERLAVVPAAVDALFFEKRPAARLERFRAHYGLPRRYLLHLGAALPRKNTRLVIEAYGAAAGAADLPPLVIGGVAAGDDATIRDWLAAAQLTDRIKVQPYLPPAEHAMLVAGAELLLYPSSYEGFGLPALEAMACGVVVLTSRRGALAETCGDAAAYAEPEVETLAAAIADLMADEGARQALVAAGAARVAPFTPAQMAARTVEVYERALAEDKATLS